MFATYIGCIVISFIASVHYYYLLCFSCRFVLKIVDTISIFTYINHIIVLNGFREYYFAIAIGEGDINRAIGLYVDDGGSGVGEYLHVLYSGCRSYCYSSE